MAPFKDSSVFLTLPWFQVLPAHLIVASPQATLSGSFEPSFRVPLDFGYGEVSKLPLSVFGAVAMAHDAEDANSAKSKFFLFRYDR